MSHDTLRNALHELAGNQPPVRVDPATFRRGRRAHRRRSLATVVATVAVVVVGGSVLLPVLDRGGTPELSAGDEGAAVPTRLHAVPERLVSYTGDGYNWHAGLLAEDLAVGTTAAVYPVNGGAVVAVSALDGRYRGLELPGFDEDAFVRYGGAPVVALSPDGDRLAYTWNPHVISDVALEDYQPSGVRVVDLATGEVTSIEITDGFGVLAHGFAWSPDGRYLAYNLHVVTEGNGTVRRTRIERLDTVTGERIVAPRRLAQTDTGPAVSSRGEVATVGNGPPTSWLPGRRPAVRQAEGDVGEWTAVWSPDGDLLATGSVDRGWFSVGDLGRTGLLTATVGDTPAGTAVRALGWVDDDDVALLHQTNEERFVISVSPARDRVRTAASRGSGEAGHDPGQVVEVDAGAAPDVTLAYALLDRPPRGFPEPDWPVDWPRTLAWSAVALAALLAWAFWSRTRHGQVGWRP